MELFSSRYALGIEILCIRSVYGVALVFLQVSSRFVLGGQDQLHCIAYYNYPRLHFVYPAYQMYMAYRQSQSPACFRLVQIIITGCQFLGILVIIRIYCHAKSGSVTSFQLQFIRCQVYLIFQTSDLGVAFCSLQQFSAYFGFGIFTGIYWDIFPFQVFFIPLFCPLVSWVGFYICYCLCINQIYLFHLDTINMNRPHRRNIL